MKEMYTFATNVRLPAGLKRRTVNIARVNNISLSDVVRMTLITLLPKIESGAFNLCGSSAATHIEENRSEPESAPSSAPILKNELGSFLENADPSAQKRTEVVFDKSLSDSLKQKQRARLRKGAR
jgi:hypothetical protein